MPLAAGRRLADSEVQLRGFAQGLGLQHGITDLISRMREMYMI